MPKIVISYMSEDAAAVAAMYKNLSANGLGVWMDKQSLTPGTPWGGSFQEVLTSADFVISFFSKHFRPDSTRVFNVEQRQIDAELRRRPSDLRFIPVRLDNSPLADIHFNEAPLRSLHCLELYGGDLKVRYERFFETFGVDNAVVPHPPHSELTLRAAHRPRSWDNGVSGFEVQLSPGGSHHMEFGTTKSVRVLPGEVIVQAFIDGNNHLPENEYWVEWFSKSEEKTITLAPFSTRILEISCTKWETTNSLSEIVKGPLRLFGALPRYGDRSTWPIGLHITQVG